MTSLRRRLVRAATVAVASVLSLPLMAVGAHAATGPAWTWGPFAQVSSGAITSTGLIAVSVYGGTDDPDATYGAVTRSVDGGPFQRVGTAPAGSSQFYVDTVTPGHRYQYGVLATGANGGQSWGYTHVMRFGIVDDSSPNLVYHGKWKVVRQAKAHGGTVHLAKGPSHPSVSFTKQFDEVDLILTVPPGGSCFSIQSDVDGEGDCATNDTGSPLYRQYAQWVAGESGKVDTVSVWRESTTTLQFDAFVITNDLTTG